MRSRAIAVAIAVAVLLPAGCAGDEGSNVEAVVREVSAEWPGAVVGYTYRDLGDNPASEELQLVLDEQLDRTAAGEIACDYLRPALEGHGLADMKFLILSEDGFAVSSEVCEQ
jgi:hypothetical protein